MLNLLMYLAKRYEICDAWKYHSSEISRTFHNGNSYTQPVFNDFEFDNTVDWEVSFDFKTSSAYARIDANVDTNYGFVGSGMADNGIKAFFGDNISSDGKVHLANNPILNTYVPVSILKEGNKITLSIGDYSIDSTVSYWSNYNTVRLLFNQWSNNNITTVKNIIIKLL